MLPSPLPRALLAGLIVIAAAFAFAASLQSLPLPHQPKSTLSPTNPQSPQATPTNPLAISTLQTHPLTRGSIAIEQEIPARSGCRTFIASYQSDDLRLYTLISRPPSPQPANGYPVLVLAHGYTDPARYSTTGPEYDGFIAHYCQAGYLVFKPDYRGHGQSEGTSTTGGHFGPDYTYDILNLAASIPSLPLANPSRLALIGHSMGGHVVLRALVAHHDLPIRAAIIAAGVVAPLADIAYRWQPNPLPADIPPIRDQIVSRYGTPEQNPTFWHQSSAVNFVSESSIPIHINHGDADTVVPHSFSQALDTALTRASKPHQFITYPGGDHQFAHPQPAQISFHPLPNFSINI